MDVQAVLDEIAADAARGEMVFPTHTEIALRVRQLLDDPGCSSERLSQLIAAEPLLAARIVGIANSVAYNPSGKVSSDLRSAVARIGFNSLRTLATAFIVRQMQEMPATPEYRALAERLWEHTTQVAALARVIARRVTRQDPEAAFFAGIVHEVGGFYLLSRAPAFPGLLAADFAAWHGAGEARVGGAVLQALDIPDSTRQAIAALWNGYLALPPESLGDTLLLADELAAVASPLGELSRLHRDGLPADIDLMLGNETLHGILADSAEEIASLGAALRA